MFEGMRLQLLAFHRWWSLRHERRRWRQGNRVGTELTIIVNGERMDVTAVGFTGSHLECMNDQYPDGFYADLSMADNRYRFLEVFDAFYRMRDQFVWPDGSLVTARELIGF